MSYLKTYRQSLSIIINTLYLMESKFIMKEQYVSYPTFILARSIKDFGVRSDSRDWLSGSRGESARDSSARESNASRDAALGGVPQ